MLQEGSTRIREALEAHMWPSHERKQPAAAGGAGRAGNGAGNGVGRQEGIVEEASEPPAAPAPAVSAPVPGARRGVLPASLANLPPVNAASLLTVSFRLFLCVQDLSTFPVEARSSWCGPPGQRIA